MIIAGTGIGKSVLENQLSLDLGIGQGTLGSDLHAQSSHLSSKPRTIKMTLGEMKDSIFNGLNVIPGSLEEETYRNMVGIATLNTATGDKFLRGLEMYLHYYCPDVLWINPVLSYLGGDASSQKDVGGFMRNGLLPLIDKYDCAAILIYHCAKPLREGHVVWNNANYAYYGLGSIEWGGASRAVLTILHVDDITKTYILRACKRESRLRWKDPLDPSKFSNDQYIRQSKAHGILRWYESSPDEIREAKKNQALARQEQQLGRNDYNDAKAEQTKKKIDAVIPDYPQGLTRNVISNMSGASWSSVTTYVGYGIEDGRYVEWEEGTNNLIGKKVDSKEKTLDTEESF